MASVVSTVEPHPNTSTSVSANCFRVLHTLDTRAAVACAARLVEGLLRFAANRGATTKATEKNADNKPPGKPEALLRLRLLRAVARSHVLEHLVRAVLLQLWRTTGTQYKAETANELKAPVYILWASLHVSTLSRAAGDPRVTRLAEQLLAGPCMQHFMLLHVVAQLGAADGGPSYGLPPTAGLPVIYVVSVTHFTGQASPGTGSQGTEAQPGAAPSAENDRQLPTEGLIHAVDFWLRCIAQQPKLPLPPIPGRALRVLCVRLADAANGALEAARANPGSGAGDAASAASSSATARPLLAHDQCVHLAQRALLCCVSSAVAAPRRVEAMAGLWRAVIRTVDNSIAEGHVRDWEDASNLLELLRPRFAGELRPESPLPLKPTSDVAAALSAGYVSRLERVLRLPHQDLVTATTATAAAAALWDHFADFGMIAVLWAYGEPREVAALIATGAKMLRRVVGALAASATQSPATRAALLQQLSRFAEGQDRMIVSGWLKWLQSFSGILTQQPQRPCAARCPGWWRRCEDHEAALCPAAALGTEGNSGGGGGGAAAASAASASGSAGSAAGVASTAPFARMCTLGTFALSRWLPAMAHAAFACQELALRGDGDCAAAASAAAAAPGTPPLGATAATAAAALCRAVYDWAHVLAAAYAAAASGPHHPDGAPAAATAVPQPAAPAEAASWRRLLLHEVDVFGLIRLHALHLTCLQRCRRQHHDGAAAAADCGIDREVREGATHIMVALPALAVALPREAAAALTVPLAPPGEPRELCRSTVLVGIELLLGTQGRQEHAEQLRLLWRVCRGWQPTAGDVRCRLVQGPQVAALVLPPPCVAASQLRLRLCANPDCASLAGDSEAALPLTQHGGGCGGAAAVYCSRDCQRAVWRGGREAGLGFSGRGGRWR